MSIITIIGTRPQYIKLKPLYDYFKNNNIDNCLIDTNQHYSDNVSKNLVKELDLKIDYNLEVKYSNEKEFLSNGFESIYSILESLRSGQGDVVMVMGDTNSTLVSSIVAKKLNMKLVHIESGLRGRNNSIRDTEEINRIIVDSISDVHFISRRIDACNVSNPVYVGDLEYSFLNSIEHLYGGISYDGPILMTIHRQENMDVKRLTDIFTFCRDLGYPILFPIHHRTKRFIDDNKIFIPSNISAIDPLTFLQVIKQLRCCRAVITDSGGLTKTSPFFGKKCILPSEQWEWNEPFEMGYTTNKLDLNWFNRYVIKRDMSLYYVENSCEIIADKIMEEELIIEK